MSLAPRKLTRPRDGLLVPVQLPVVPGFISGPDWVLGQHFAVNSEIGAGRPVRPAEIELWPTSVTTPASPPTATYAEQPIAAPTVQPFFDPAESAKSLPPPSNLDDWELVALPDTSPATTEPVSVEQHGELTRDELAEVLGERVVEPVPVQHSIWQAIFGRAARAAPPSPFGRAAAAAPPSPAGRPAVTQPGAPMSIWSELGQMGIQIGGELLSSYIGSNSNQAGSASTGLVPMPGSGFTTGGSFGATAPAGGWGTRKRRRMNPTNVHALRRSLRRVESFIKIEKRVDKILRRIAPKARSAQRVGFVKRK